MMEQGCVLCPVSLLPGIDTHNLVSSLVAEVISVLSISLVSHSLAAAGRKATLWGRGDMASLPGPLPGVCCSWGVPTVGLQQNCLQIMGAQYHHFP